MAPSVYRLDRRHFIQKSGEIVDHLRGATSLENISIHSILIVLSMAVLGLPFYCLGRIFGFAPHIEFKFVSLVA